MSFFYTNQTYPLEKFIIIKYQDMLTLAQSMSAVLTTQIPPLDLNQDLPAQPT